MLLKIIKMIEDEMLSNIFSKNYNNEIIKINWQERIVYLVMLSPACHTVAPLLVKLSGYVPSIPFSSV